jgi:hypothetical protein
VAFWSSLANTRFESVARNEDGFSIQAFVLLYQRITSPTSDPPGGVAAVLATCSQFPSLISVTTPLLVGLSECARWRTPSSATDVWPVRQAAGALAVEACRTTNRGAQRHKRGRGFTRRLRDNAALSQPASR